MGTLQNRAEQILLSASELEETERDAYVNEACGSDPELARHVRELQDAARTRS